MCRSVDRYDVSHEDHQLAIQMVASMYVTFVL
jgi:hypothetical protein